jgi:hypothetical protein
VRKLLGSGDLGEQSPPTQPLVVEGSSAAAGLRGARRRSMPVFQELLRRLGFVKLGRYGLTLTADDRIVSTRPAVLDDGGGQRVVGWRDDDLAMAELAPWQSAVDGAQPPVRRAQLSATQPPRLPGVSLRVAAVLPVAQPMIPQPSRSAQVAAHAAAPVAPAHAMPLAVAPEAVVAEDDWEWSIALAKARAAADETTAPLVPLQPMPAPAIAMIPAPMTGPPAPPPLFAQSTPASPLSARARTPSAPPLPGQPAPLGSSTPPPATVIPVPRLPSIRDAERAGRFEPVVRTTIGPAPAPPPGRLAKGTAPIGSDTEETPAVMSDDTELTLSVGDRTTPGVAMPLVARAVALPSIKGGSPRRG